MRSPLLLCLVPLVALAIGCDHSKRKANTGTDIEGDGSKAGDSSGPPGKAPPELVRPGIPTITFPGFQVLPDGRSVITVQSTGPTNVTEQKAEGRLIYSLQGVSVPYKVNKLPLVTTNFPTQVSRVEVDQIGGGASVVIELREPATAICLVTKMEGGTLVTITLPRSEKFGSSKGPMGSTEHHADWEGTEEEPRRPHKGSNDGYGR